MRQRRLGERLRALILATPLIAAPGCFPGLPGCPDETSVFALVNRWDGGALTVLPVDGGCVDACQILVENLDRCYEGCGVSSCALVDAGLVRCTSYVICPGGRRPASLLAAAASRGGFIWPCGLGDALRAVVLATPLIAVPACSGSECYGRDGGVYALTVDAGNCMDACSALATGPFRTDTCSFVTLDGGPGVSCAGPQLCAGGRRPFALLATNDRATARPLGRYFSEAARLEAASIPAFRVLARELRQHCAPAHLVRAAARSAQDEVRHDRSTAALARRYGAEPIRPSFGPTPSERSLEAIATENAVEGCVRETYGALVALWQARHAGDPVVGAAMGPIAADETRHAELAWEVAAWAEPRLSRAARGRIDAVRAQALADLTTEVSSAVPTALVALAGLPPPETVGVLLSGLGKVLELTSA